MIVIKKIFVSILLLLVFCLLPRSVFAQTEFSSSYDVAYDVLENGLTEVTEKITLKNLTDKYFASNFSLTITADDIQDLEAFDAQSPIVAQSQKLNNKTQINVMFTTQVVGKDKEYPWTLKFKSKNFADKEGSVWQVFIPRISDKADISQFNLNLMVPVSFGDPTTITPEPRNQSEYGGKISYKFTKDQLVNSGLLANFGSSQMLDFTLSYKLNNSSILPKIFPLAIPTNSDFQQVLINNITPKPENVTFDFDGNALGWFKVSPRQNLEVKVSGRVNLLLKAPKATSLKEAEITSYTSEQKYWEKSNPLITTKLSEILTPQAKTNQQKAELINLFLANHINFSQDRHWGKDSQRLGAVTSLRNPEKALSLEFSDLFMSFTRAAGIPSRQLIGYAVSSNNILRPSSYKKSLHVWAEYFDPNLGWVMVDPTWQNTTGGVDYFSKFDLNHFVLLTRGLSSDQPDTADEVKINFSKDEFKPISSLKIEIDAPNEIFAIFPTKAKIRIENTGNSVVPEAKLSFRSDKINISGQNYFTVPKLPPNGHFESSFDLRTASPLDSYDDFLQLKVGDQVITKKIAIKPFFVHKYFSLAVLGVTVVMVSIYFGILVHYLQKVKRHKAMSQAGHHKAKHHRK